MTTFFATCNYWDLSSEPRNARGRLKRTFIPTKPTTVETDTPGTSRSNNAADWQTYRIRAPEWARHHGGVRVRLIQDGVRDENGNLLPSGVSGYFLDKFDGINGTDAIGGAIQAYDGVIPMDGGNPWVPTQYVASANVYQGVTLDDTWQTFSTRGDEGDFAIVWLAGMSTSGFTVEFIEDPTLDGACP